MVRLEDLLAACEGAHVVGPASAETFGGFGFDSRIILPGEMFLAVRTEKADGHDHIEAAARAGATGVLCQRAPGTDGERTAAELGLTCVFVPDTEVAILQWARHVVAAWGVRVVAITGSVGKTGAKEMIGHVLSSRQRVFRNPANYSGRYGLPIALGGLSPHDEVAVLEMATDHFGEIELLAGLAPPEIAFVTLISPAHLAAFGTLENVAREKGDLIAALPPAPLGLAILNADDPRVLGMAERTLAEIVRLRVAADGAREPDGPAELWATDVRLSRDGTTFRLHGAGGRRREPAGDSMPRDERSELRFDTAQDRPDVAAIDQEQAASGIAEGSTVELMVRVPWIGRHVVGTALGAVAVGRRFGIPDELIVERLATLPHVPGRLRPLPARGGGLILDDSYNASPAAVMAALDALEVLGAGGGRDETQPRLIVALGDMAELGEASESEHRRVGARAAEVADLLITCGREAAIAAEAARAAGMTAERVVVTNRTEDAAAAIEPFLGPRTIILAKGSAVTRMERVVAALMAQPESAGALLVRQDAAWQHIVVVRPDRPTWLEIDLGALAHNTRHLAARAGDAALMAVIKADGYGHGAVRVARTALHNGATWLGVACVPEGIEIRRAGIEAPTLILGYTPAWQAQDVVRHALAVTVFDERTAHALSKAAQALDRTVRVHVKVDTGLHRVGMRPAKVPGMLELLHGLPGIEVEGLFTHFAVADEASADSLAATAVQAQVFEDLVSRLQAEGIRPPIVHVANSAALLAAGVPKLGDGALGEHMPGDQEGDGPNGDRAFIDGIDSSQPAPRIRWDLVRTGIGLYGLAPSADVGDPELRPVMAWKTQVAQVLTLEPGEAVGYGREWIAERTSRIAAIPVGYADGFRRAPTRWHHVLVRGKAAPLVGRVSMDQASIDVTDIPGVRQGDEVVLIGRQGELEISAETVAEWLGTINYEVVSAILARVSRVS